MEPAASIAGRRIRNIMLLGSEENRRAVESEIGSTLEGNVPK